MRAHLTNCVHIWSLSVGLTKCAAQFTKRARVWPNARPNARAIYQTLRIWSNTARLTNWSNAPYNIIATGAPHSSLAWQSGWTELPAWWSKLPVRLLELPVHQWLTLRAARLTADSEWVWGMVGDSERLLHIVWEKRSTITGLIVIKTIVQHLQYRFPGPARRELHWATTTTTTTNRASAMKRLHGPWRKERCWSYYLPKHTQLQFKCENIIKLTRVDQLRQKYVLIHNVKPLHNIEITYSRASLIFLDLCHIWQWLTKVKVTLLRHQCDLVLNHRKRVVYILVGTSEC